MPRTPQTPKTIHRLLQLAASHFDVDEKTLHAADDLFKKLGIDSVQALELLSEVEMAFDIEIPDYELQDITTFASLAELIDKKR